MKVPVKKRKQCKCCICGIALETEYSLEEDYDDGTDDIYDLCPNCYPKFDDWMKKKGDKNVH